MKKVKFSLIYDRPDAEKYERISDHYIIDCESITGIYAGRRRSKNCLIIRMNNGDYYSLQFSPSTSSTIFEQFVTAFTTHQSEGCIDLGLISTSDLCVVTSYVNLMR